MRLLDRYISKELVSTFITCLITFSILYLIIDTFSMLEDIKKNVNLIALLSYYLTLLPSIFTNTAPFAMLLSTLYCLGRFSHNNEIIAMRASGLSIFRIASPMLILSLILTGFVFLANERIIPYANKANKQIRSEKLISKEKDGGKKEIKNIALFSKNNRLIFIGKFNQQTNIIDDINILEQDSYQNVKAKIIASKGKWVEGTTWKLYQVITYNFEIPMLNQASYEPIYNENLLFDLEQKPSDLLKRNVDSENMNIRELRSYIDKISQTNAKPVLRNLNVDLQQKIALPFTVLIVTIIGIPFGFTSKRRGTAVASLGICFLISLLYYAANAIGIALGKGGILYPIVSAWIAHIIFAAFGLTLLALLP